MTSSDYPLLAIPGHELYQLAHIATFVADGLARHRRAASRRDKDGRDMPSVHLAMQRGAVQYLVKPFRFRALAERLTVYRDLWTRTRSGGEVEQVEVDRIFGLMRSVETTSVLPKGCSEATMALVRAVFAEPDAECSASEVADRVGISRTTAQRYLAHLADTGSIELRLRYGSAGRPEHRYRARD